MKHTLLSITLALFALCNAIAQDPMIDLMPESVTQTSEGAKTAGRLVDGNIGTAWFTGWAPAFYPMKCRIDLNGSYTITRFRFYDGSGIPSITITDQQGRVLGNFDMNLYLSYRDVTIAPLSGVEFIYLEMTGPQGDFAITEFEVFGKRDGITPPPPIDTTKPPIVVRPDTAPFSIGTNGFHWVPTSSLEGFDHLRQYIVWDWLEATKGNYKFEPTWGADGKYDTHWDKLKSIGIKPIACVNQSPKYIQSTYPTEDPDVRPCYYTDNPTKAESYADFARFWFQLSARYGSKKWANDVLRVDSTERWTNEGKNIKKSGLGLLEFCEIWNEPDKWWKKPGPAYLEPEQYAAMLSACYDGHEGRIPFAGVKTADPTMQVVMAGLTEFDSVYITRMAAWFTANRIDKKFACDVMNFHHYCNEDGGIFKGREYGVAPELDKVGKQMRDIKRVCSKLNPTAKVWWSEFGYDTDASGPHQSRGFGAYTPEKVQGLWIMRSFLECIAAGFDAAHIYNAIDEPNPTGGLFQSSGILKGQNGVPQYGNKQGYDYVKTLINEIGGYKMIYSDTNADGVRLMLFESVGVVKAVYWTPCAAECTTNIIITGKVLKATELPQIIRIF
jgi:hypothetical protein